MANTSTETYFMTDVTTDLTNVDLDGIKSIVSFQNVNSTLILPRYINKYQRITIIQQNTNAFTLTVRSYNAMAVLVTLGVINTAAAGAAAGTGNYAEIIYNGLPNSVNVANGYQFLPYEFLKPSVIPAPGVPFEADFVTIDPITFLPTFSNPNSVLSTWSGGTTAMGETAIQSSVPLSSVITMPSATIGKIAVQNVTNTDPQHFQVDTADTITSLNVADNFFILVTFA